MKALALPVLLPVMAVAAPAIPAGSLDQALRAYSFASGVLLGVEGRLTQDVHSPGLAALSVPERDLPLLLAGSGLEAVRRPDGSYVLRPAPAGAAPVAAGDAQAVQQLPTVVAHADLPLDAVGSFAIRGGAALRETPQSVSVVGANTIRERHLLSMDDLLAYVPGVRPSLGEGNRDNAVFRGYNSSADFFLNGMRDDVQYFRDFYNIETVEVLKGPNAMASGRGGSGGAVNRVGKQAQWRDIGDIDLLFGQWGQKRVVLDAGRAWSPQWAWRLNLVDEDSSSFRAGAWLKRYGLTPTLAWRDDAGTLLQLSYEHFRDHRSTDRGVPSYNGRPVDVDPSVFFGDPAHSDNAVNIDAFTARLERQLAPALSFSSQLHAARYDKYYKNVFSGGMDDGGATVRMLGYGSTTYRSNLFYQADLTATLYTGTVQHRLGGGLELGRQRADNGRSTGYFDTLGPDVRFISVPLAQPTFDLPVSFRASPTDSSNASTARTVALYLQDQISLTPEWQLLAGARAERLQVDFVDTRNGVRLASRDRPLSPRLGLVWHPGPEWTLYASRSQAYAARVGEQMASLTASNQDLAPEVVRNMELGARWEHGGRMSASLALYQLKRSNVLLADPVNAGDNELVDGQRGQGAELELAGRLAPAWTLSAGYAWQRSWLTATQSSNALAGAAMPHVPRHSMSLYSTHAVAAGWEASWAVLARSGMFSSTSNKVLLPGYVRLDASLNWQVDPRKRLQFSVENLLDRRYYASSYNDNNISPGAPRGLRLALHIRY